MENRTHNVMLRFSEGELARLMGAWESSQKATTAWNREPFAAWVRRTVLSLFPAKPAPAPKGKPVAKARRRS
jgi:hypothetical protein